jgi:hypothetical protein
MEQDAVWIDESKEVGERALSTRGTARYAKEKKWQRMNVHIGRQSARLLGKGRQSLAESGILWPVDIKVVPGSGTNFGWSSE